MSEPTKEAIEEADALVERFQVQGPKGQIYIIGVKLLISIIAHVRKKARDDALEDAAEYCESPVQVCCGRGNENGCCGDPHIEPMCPPEISEAIRALKDQPSGEQP